MSFSPTLIKGSIAPVILSLLRDRAMYGYEMVKIVNARTGGKLQWREGTLYPALHKLEAMGLVKARWMDAPAPTNGPRAGLSSGRSRKYYSITRTGKAELVKRSDEWREFSDAINGLMSPEGA